MTADLPDYVVDAEADRPVEKVVTEEGHEVEFEIPSKAALTEKPFKVAKEEWITSFERDYIADLLRRHGGNISQAAREADIDRKYFRKLMDKHEVSADDY